MGTKGSSLTHPDLHVFRNGLDPKVRRAYQHNNISPDVGMSLHNSEISNLEQGMLQRVFFVSDGEGGFKRPPQPVKNSYLDGDLARTRQFLVDGLVGSTPVTEHEFAHMYTGRKLALNLAAADSLLIDAVVKKDSNTSVFVKAEKTVKSLCRIISPQNRRYLVASGRYIKPIEKKLVSGINALFGETTIMKGLNATDSGIEMARCWNTYTNPVCVGLDASRFDQHMSVDALKWEHSVYNGIYRNDPELVKLMKWQLDPRGAGYCHDGRLRYKVSGTRTSGCINTGLGNCLVMCALVHAFMSFKGIERYSLKNNGDDCVVFMEKHHLREFSNGLSQWFLDKGFNMVVEPPVYVLEQVVFCQTQPVEINGEYRMVRQAPMSFAKDSMFIKPLDKPSVWKKMLDSVGKCGLSLTGGVPVCQNFYDAYVRSAARLDLKRSRSRRTTQRRKRNQLEGDPSMETGMVNLAIGMDAARAVPSDATRVSFWLAFGITPDEQLRLENHFDNISFVHDSAEFLREREYVFW